MAPSDPSGPASGDTQPVPSSTQPTPAASRRRRWLRWLALLLILALVAGSVSGYLAGSGQRRAARLQAFSAKAKEQFDLGVQDLQAQRYELARQRFEYVIQIDPGYPGIIDQMAAVLVALHAPTSTPISLASPTPNNAPVEQLLTEARASLGSGDWTTTIDTLIGLRAKDPTYKAVEVDGLLFAALRNRGVQRISKEGALAEGLYDLSRAERFAPLDRDADNWRNWAELYLTADSFMGLNWAEATRLFAQVFAVSPYLRNDAYFKYAMSAQSYAEQLMAAKDPCGAMDPYGQSLTAMPNATLEPTATYAADACAKATAPKPPPRSATNTPGPETPTPEPPTPTPTETPTP